MEYKNRFEKYRKTHKELVKQRIENWKEENRENIRKFDKDYYQTHKERIGELHMQTRRRLREKVIIALGGKCACCGEIDRRCLQIDHVNGGGRQERKQFKSPYSYLLFILKQIHLGSKDYQCLCANCNFKKAR